jgi:hypothetical protein
MPFAIHQKSPLSFYPRLCKSVASKLLVSESASSPVALTRIGHFPNCTI